MYWIGPWRPASPSTGVLGVAVTTIQVLTVRQAIVTTAIRLVVTTSMVVVQHFILSKQKTEKAYNQNPKN